MKTRFSILAAVVITIMVLFALGFSTAQTTTTTLTVVERATTDVVTDTGAEGDSVGDVLTFANDVYDEANAEKVGTDNGYCVRTVVGGAWECAWSLVLEDGQIMVAGTFHDAGDSVLAITGGTGAYQSARGQMTLHFRDEAGTEFDFVYEIVMD